MTSLPQTYKHRIETRTQKQIFLTNRLCSLLSSRNLQRIENPLPTVPFANFYFVCLSGIPPFETQFQNLGLPGDKTVIALEGLNGIRSEEEYRKIFQIGGFQYEAQKMRKIVEDKYKQFKIVVLFHSFGSFTFMNYLRMFPEHHLSGIIDIGGAPLRYYPLLSNLISNFHMVSHQFLLQNHTQIHDAYLADPELKKAGFIPFENSYQTIIFLKLPTCPSFQDMFEYMRNLPQILKLWVYGCKDRIFPEELVNEKIVYYSYSKYFEEESGKSQAKIKGKAISQDGLQQRYARAYEKYYGLGLGQCKNVQDKFVFGIPNGQHSIHMQNKYNTEIQTAIKNYLGVLSIALEN